MYSFRSVDRNISGEKLVKSYFRLLQLDELIKIVQSSDAQIKILGEYSLSTVRTNKHEQNIPS